MRLIILSITFLFIISGCSNKNCPTSSVELNRNVYKRYLVIMNESKNKNKFVMPKEVEEAIKYLQTVSGISTKAQRHDNWVYKNKADFRRDIVNWKKWYKENKCKLTLKYVDSAFKSIKINN